MSAALPDKFRITADFRFTAWQAKAVAAAVIGPMLLAAVWQIVFMKDYITPAGPQLGGDYVVFWTAAKAMAAGDAAAIYDPAALKEWFARIAPNGENLRLTWQYPPTYYFVIGFLALFPYGLGYAAWTGGGFAIFAVSARKAGVRGTAYLLILLAPVAFQAAITGQNGFLTASLFLGATLLPDKRPVVAGLCAALLTIKPQLGLLIPIAYIAGGHWRAFGVAAAGAVLLAGASVAVFGLDAWSAFFESVLGAGQNVGSGLMPLFKMPTVFAAASLAGAPAPLAAVFQLAGAAGAAFVTFIVWRKSDNAALKAAAVCIGAFLVAPYAYYYEMVIMAAPVALLAMQAAREGWRKYDHFILAELFFVPLLMGEAAKTGINLFFVTTVLAMVFALRRFEGSFKPAF